MAEKIPGDRPVHYFPDPEHPALQPLTQAFVRLMFAHARFERRVADLLDVIDPDSESGERDRWTARDRPKKTRKLIARCLDKHPGGIPEGEEIARLLCQAIPLCDERNLLAHGVWWSFDTEAQTITVRSDRPGEEQHQRRRQTDIERSAIALKGAEIDIYKIQREIETRRPT